MYNSVSSEDINYFSDLLQSRCLFSDEHKEIYSRDETEDLSYHPEVVLKPNSTSEISQILKYLLIIDYIRMSPMTDKVHHFCGN